MQKLFKKGTNRGIPFRVYVVSFPDSDTKWYKVEVATQELGWASWTRLPNELVHPMLGMMITLVSRGMEGDIKDEGVERFGLDPRDYKHESIYMSEVASPSSSEYDITHDVIRLGTEKDYYEKGIPTILAHELGHKFAAPEESVVAEEEAWRWAKPGLERTGEWEEGKEYAIDTLSSHYMLDRPKSFDDVKSFIGLMSLGAGRKRARKFFEELE